MGANVIRWPSLPEQDELFPQENFGAPGTEKISAPVLDMGTNDVTTAVTAAIRRHWEGRKDAAKGCARQANTNTRTAKNWLEGKNLPNVVDFLKLCAQMPELAGLVRELVGLRQDMDPEFNVALQKLMQLAARGGRGK